MTPNRHQLHPGRVLVHLSLFVAVLALTGCKIKPQPAADPAADPADPAPQADPAAQAPKLALASLVPPTQLSNRAAFDKPNQIARPTERRPAPMALTGSDGSGLVLRHMNARAVIDGPLAFTELHLRFHNPEPRRREGRFSITLPSGAAVSRFAMRIGGKWMEGEVVGKQRARQVYEDFLHRKQDPALLEQDTGNVFSARVFPIEARADKELIISWSQELADSRTAWVLPLAGLPALQTLDIEAFVHSGKDKAPGKKPPSTLHGGSAHMEVVSIHKRDFEPWEDLIVWPGYLKAPWSALRHKRRFVARIQPPGGAANDNFERLVVLFDTSASAAPRYAARIGALAEMLQFAGTHGAKHATIIAFDQDAETIWSGRPADFDQAAQAKLGAREALGASDMGVALQAAARAARSAEAKVRVVLFSDGVVTLGERSASKLAQKATALADAGVVRLDAVTLASARDDQLLAALVGAKLPRHGIVAQISDHEEHPFDRLALRTFAPIDVRVPGADWIWPRRITGLQAGQQALVYGELAPGVPLEIEFSGGAEGKVTPTWRVGAEPLIERSTVKARIDALLREADEGDETIAKARKAQALKLSIHHRVLCPLTALLVLETENDYVRYGIDRKALRDVLAISDGGIAVRQQRRYHGPGLLGLLQGKIGDGSLDEAFSGNRGGEGAARPETESAEERPRVAAAQPMGRMPDSNRFKDAERKRRARMAVSKKTISGAFAAGADLDRALATRGVGHGGGGTIGDLGDMGGGGAVRVGGGGGGRARLGRAKGAKIAPSRTSRPKPAAKAPRAPPAAEPSPADFAPPPPAMADKPAKESAKKSKAKIAVRADMGATAGGATGMAFDPTMRRTRPMRRRPQVRVVRVDAQDRNWSRGAHMRLHRMNRVIGSCMRMQPNVAAFGGLVFRVDTTGRASKVRVLGLSGSAEFCIRRRVERLRFAPPRRDQRVRAWYDLSGGNVHIPRPPRYIPRRRKKPDPGVRGRAELARIERDLKAKSPWRDNYASIRQQLAAGHTEEALAAAWRWRKAQVGDVMALVALGDAARSRADTALAARAWGSIIDLHPNRADTRRFAGDLLQQLGKETSELAIDTFQAAAEDRPDHPTGHHLLAMALASAGRYDDALAAIDKGLKTQHRGTARAIDRVLRDDAADIGAAIIAKEPARKDAIVARLKTMGTAPTTRPRLRVVLTWETDANDVDLHVFDSGNHHAWFKRRHLKNGRGDLYKTAFGGFGPEAFVVNKPKRYPYRLFAYYYRMGPMGWGMGQAQVIRADGKGGLGTEARPYVLQRDKAWVDLGTVTAATAPVGG